jgi:arginine-tRNA-protein transferase
MEVLERFETPPHACPYLAGRAARLDYSFAPDLTAEEYEDLMNRGYRKFGALFFRPVCDGCRACRPIRVPVATFVPDRSQTRAWRRNADLAVRLARPSVDRERLDLYNRYHQDQTRRKGWPSVDKDPTDYAASFVGNPIPSIELSVWEGRVLRAVLIAEVTPNVVSAVYHYHDLTLPGRGLGTFCILNTIELARKLGKPYVYLGYYVAGCPSMEYKARFRPCELMGEDGVWRARVQTT